jgi:CRP/FNR family cyclic AMP-dependent transcriptional regulator
MAVLSEQLLATLAQRGVQRSYPAKTLLLHEADPSHYLFVVLSGSLKVFGSSELGRDVIYRSLGPGDVFGELGLDGGASSTSVMTLQRSRCSLLQNVHVPELMAESPDFGQFLFGRLVSQVRAGNSNVKQLALDTAYQPPARLLDNLEHTVVLGQRVLCGRLTQQVIGERIGCSREMVSRLLQCMRKDGHIAMDGHRIVLLRDSLSQIS